MTTKIMDRFLRFLKKKNGDEILIDLDVHTYIY